MKEVDEITSSKDGYGVYAIRPPDAKFKKMKAIYDACIAGGVDVPDDVEEFFDYEEPDPLGTQVEIKKVQLLKGEYELGFQMAVKDVPSWATHIRFTVRPDC